MSDPQPSSSKSQAKESEPSKKTQPQPVAASNKDGRVDYNVLAHLRKIPALLSVYDALMLSEELSEACAFQSVLACIAITVQSPNIQGRSAKKGKAVML